MRLDLWPGSGKLEFKASRRRPDKTLKHLEHGFHSHGFNSQSLALSACQSPSFYSLARAFDTVRLDLWLGSGKLEFQASRRRPDKTLKDLIPSPWARIAIPALLLLCLFFISLSIHPALLLTGPLFNPSRCTPPPPLFCSLFLFHFSPQYSAKALFSLMMMMMKMPMIVMAVFYRDDG